MKKSKQHTLDVTTELMAEAIRKQLPRERLERVERASFIAHDKVRWFKASFSGSSPLAVFLALSEAGERMAGAKVQDIFEEFARILGATVGAKVTCSSVVGEEPQESAATVRFELFPAVGPAAEVIVCVPESTLDSLTRDIPFSPSNDSRRPLDALMNIDLPVTITFGSVEVPLGDVLKLTTGSIVELNHRLNEPVDIVVNRCLVARGEVVVVDGNYGVRISEVVTKAGVR